MRSSKTLKMLVLALLITTLLTACGAATPTEDPNIKITQVAGTIQADLTQAAAMTPSVTATIEVTPTATEVPPTETPSGPTSTPTKTPYPTTDPSAIANNAKFITDVTFPDGSDFARGETFVKTWQFHNIGTTTWSTGYKLVFVGGDTKLIGAGGIYYVYLPEVVEPKGYVDISITFVAPTELGTYTSYWQLYTDQGVPFGDTVRIVIDVTETGHM